MSTLLVDLGNSRLKSAWLENGVPQNVASLDHRELELSELLTQHWSGLQRAQRVIVACVAANPVREQFETWVAKHWNSQVQFLSSPERGHGLVNSYADPGRLGSDRWAAMVAAHQRTDGAFCVVDCGSAVTLDVVDASGRHRGGLILPGLHAMRQALGETTSLIVSEPEDSETLRLGTSTASAVQAGISGAVAALVFRTVTEQQQELDMNLRCFLTGGDAPRIAPLLSIPYEYQANLVLEGLAIVAGDSV